MSTLLQLTVNWAMTAPVFTDVTRLILTGTTLLFVCFRFVNLPDLFRSAWACLFGASEEEDKKEAEATVSGPRGLPFFGYMPFLGRHPHKTLARLAERFGPMFRLRAGFRQFVVMSSVDKILDMARRYPEELYGKPRTFTTEKLTVGAHNDMLHRWKKRRAYTNAGLKYLERYSITDIIQEEVGNILEFAGAISGRAKDIRHDISFFVSSVLYRVAYGGRPDESAREGLRRMVHSMPDYTTTIGSFSPFDLIPFLRHVFKDKFLKFVEFNRFMSRFCRQEKVKVLEQSGSEGEEEQANEPPSDLFHFFKQKWERMSDADRKKFSLTDDILYDGLEDIIRAGTESSSLIIQWFLLYMTAFPQVQQKMQAELDEYMSNRRHRDLPEVEDLANLPYCQAVLLETYRFCCLNPFLKRELTADIVVDGVRLKRGTVVLFNNWAINNDPTKWDRPEEFRPERFLLDDGSVDQERAENFIPFGFGKRRCIGVYTGKSLCALAAISLVHKFDVHPEEEGSKPDLESVFGIGLSPKEYKVVFRKRS